FPAPTPTCPATNTCLVPCASTHTTWLKKVLQSGRSGGFRWVHSITRPPAPSMRMAVKPRQAFFRPPRTDHAAGPPAGFPSRPCFPPEHLAPAAALPSPRAGEGGGGDKMLRAFIPARRARPGVVPRALRVGWRVCRSGRQARTTVYPWGTGHGPQHLVPYTP